MYTYSNPGLLRQGLQFFKSVKWGSILDGTQKTLGVINQAIPIVYQVKPMVHNMGTLFKIASRLNDSSTPTSPTTTSSIPLTTSTSSNTSYNKPVFYI